MANDEQRDISTSPQEPVPASAEEQQHEGSFAPSERNPAAHPQDTDNLEHDHQAVFGAAPADETADGEQTASNADGDGDAADEGVEGEARGPLDYPRVGADSSEVLAENPEVDEEPKTHPDLQTEVGLPDPNVRPEDLNQED